jgi:hypothetical protein
LSFYFIFRKKVDLFLGANDGRKEDALLGGLQPAGGADEGGASLGLVSTSSNVFSPFLTLH